MRPINVKSDNIRKFIIDNIEDHPNDIVTLTSKKFDVSRQAIQKYMKLFIKEGILSKKGNTRKTRYLSNKISDFYQKFPINNLKEDLVWKDYIKPYFKNIPKNVFDLCQSGFTGIVNNAIVHSEGYNIYVDLKIFSSYIEFNILDDGIGIFNKIEKKLGLLEPLDVILDIAKGKITTNPEEHSGDGIFYISRMFDNFIINSGNICYKNSETENLWEVNDDLDLLKGTLVKLKISTNTNRSYQKVFDKYLKKGNNYYLKAYIPVNLARFGDESLLSRSQAKRLLNHYEKFSEIYLDFKGLNLLGLDFADEIFRVYKNKNPDINLHFINAVPNVKAMILRVITAI